MAFTTEQLPWPESEHIRAAANARERLYDELHYSGRGRELRDRLLTELGALYEPANLHKSFLSFSQLRHQARAMSSQPLDQQTQKQYALSNLIFATGLGTVTALHTYLPDVANRRSIPFFSLYYREIENDISDSRRDELQDLSMMFDVALPDFFDTLPDDLQEGIVEFSQELFCDYPPMVRTEYENEFILGYVYAIFEINNIDSILSDKDS